MTYGDGLPALHADQDGPFSIIQAYDTRTPQTRLAGIYVLRPRIIRARFAQQRKINRYDFRLKLVWPIGATTSGSGLWETEQRAFDAAVELLLQRIDGFPLDKTHGGRFMSVAEAPEPGAVTVAFADPAQARANVLEATIAYLADDIDFVA